MNHGQREQTEMLPDVESSDYRSVNVKLLWCLFQSVQLVEAAAARDLQLAGDMWGDMAIGRALDSRSAGLQDPPAGCARPVLQNVMGWIRAHEEAQVMVASVLVVVCVWWVVRALLALVINLVCLLVLVLFAVVCVPQLREPLLGQNYPAVAKLLRAILLRLADNFKQID